LVWRFRLTKSRMRLMQDLLRVWTSYVGKCQSSYITAPPCTVNGSSPGYVVLITFDINRDLCNMLLKHSHSIDRLCSVVRRRVAATKEYLSLSLKIGVATTSGASFLKQDMACWGAWKTRFTPSIATKVRHDDLVNCSKKQSIVVDVKYSRKPIHSCSSCLRL